MHAILLALLIAGCHEESFVSDTVEEQTQTNNTDDVKAKTPEPSIASEPLSSKTYHQLSPQLFTLNPHGATQSMTVGFTKEVRITMESLTGQATETKTSPARTRYSQSFTQTGRDGTPSRVDTFNRQRDKGLLDLLLVVDDSISMSIVRTGSTSSVHAKMVNNLSGLLSQINNSNWQINIVDVDTNQLCEHTIINRTNQALYGSTLQALKNSPNLVERAIIKSRIALGLDRRCNYSWVRANSTLALIIITDEDHQCTNSGAADNRGNDSNSFFCGNELSDFITAFRRIRPTTRLYGIFDTNANCGNYRTDYKCYDRGVTNSHSVCPITNPCYNREDNELVRSLNYLAPGRSAYDLVSDINSANYNGILSSISANISEILQDQFTLSYTPDNRGVEVRVNNIVTTSYRLTGKILTFTSDPGGDNISVSYVPAGGAQPIAYINTLYVSDPNADLSTATVSINNRTLTRGSEYSVNGRTIILNGNMRNVFPSGTSATVYYYQHQTKQRSFTFASGKEVVNSSVWVAGVSNNFTLQRNPNQIVFNSGHEPNYGTTFSIGYSYYSGNKLNYPISDRWSVERIECDGGVSCQYNNNNIVITGGFRRGGTFIATIHPTSNTQAQSDYIDTPINYVPGSMCLARELRQCQQEDNGSCDGRRCCSEEQLVINNKKIMLTTTNADANGCEMIRVITADDIDQLHLHYQTYTPQQQIDEVNAPPADFFGQYKNERWEVFVNREKKTEGSDYTIDQSERTIDFKGQYPVDSKGSVVIYLE